MEETKLIELADELMHVENDANDLSEDYKEAFDGGICTARKLEKIGLVAVIREIAEDTVAEIKIDINTLLQAGAEYLITGTHSFPDERVQIQSLKKLNQQLLIESIRESVGRTGTGRYWTLDREKPLQPQRLSQRPGSFYPQESVFSS
jgi:hypothetical protein